MEKKNKPAIRFKGFVEDWENEKLFHLASFSKGNGYSKSDLTDTGHPILLYGSLYTNYRTTIKNVETYVNAKSENVLSKGGEVVVPASGETQEDIVRASVIEMENIILGGDLNVIIPNNELDATFLALTISNGNVYKELVKKAQGKSVVHIRNSDLQEALIPYPNKTEQQKIGNFFENIDQLITQHQEKQSKLQALKKAMLSKMFPKQGQTVPEIRFKGFEGDWVEKNVGIICSTTIGVFVIKTKQNDLSPYPVYNGGISYTGFYDEYNNEPNKIVISARGANAGFVNIVKTKYWAGNSCYSVDVLDKESFDIDFLFYYIKENQSRFLENQQAANIPSVSKSDVERFLIFHPTKSEQTVIAKYLLSLDNLISNHQTQMTKLQNIKKALLAKMFV